MGNLLTSCICTHKQLESVDFQFWCERMGEDKLSKQRKTWEYCYISQALYERDMLKPGRKGLGFGVGREPLTALFASYGCTILATDLDEQAEDAKYWVDILQNGASLNERGICDAEIFQQNVSFQVVDMNAIPEELQGFDFCWSGSSLDHLGSLENGKQFLYNMLKCLKPGGIGVHTTEYNITSNTDTIDHGPLVLYRRCDLEEIATTLKKDGHRIDLDFTPGEGDCQSFKGYDFTSIGLIIQKGK